MNVENLEIPGGVKMCFFVLHVFCSDRTVPFFQCIFSVNHDQENWGDLYIDVNHPMMQ